MQQKQGFLWAILFISIFLLSQDYLFYDWETKISFLGFPSWLAWFMTVHVLFIVAFAFFIRKYWKA